eukprot:3311225-Pyramimonas_sp.AAC.1
MTIKYLEQLTTLMANNKLSYRTSRVDNVASRGVMIVWNHSTFPFQVQLPILEVLFTLHASFNPVSCFLFHRGTSRSGVVILLTTTLSEPVKRRSQRLATPGRTPNR